MKLHVSILILNLLIGMEALIAQNSSNYLFGIEEKIMNARSQSFELDDNAPLLAVLDSLSAIDNLGATHWKEYWTSYALYQKSIFAAYGKSPDEAQGKQAVEEAINTLKDVKSKNVEDYAMLGMTKGFSLQWKSMFAMAKESSVASKWAKTAVAMDDQNPRAQYVFGNNDFHTPTIFGGGKKAEEYLTRAIALFKESVPNPLLPSWGMQDTYYMLVSAKLKADNNEEAKEVLAEALLRFPENNRLLGLKNKISE